jgi:hypothetical protein
LISFATVLLNRLTFDAHFAGRIKAREQMFIVGEEKHARASWAFRDAGG